MKNFRRKAGFTVIELMIVIGLTAVLVLFLYSIVSNTVKQNAKSQQANEGWLEATTMATAFNLSLKNVVKLDPPEPLKEGAVPRYFGLTTITDPAVVPSDCKFDARYSVVRLTTILSRLRAEKVLRAWSTKSSGKNTPADELRITYEEEKSAFSAKKNLPTELVLVDIDGKWKRRYEVVQHRLEKSVKNPMDDQTYKDADGLPIVYEYSRILLREPLYPSVFKSIPLPNPPFTFITNSMVFMTKTSFICVSKSTGALIEIVGKNVNPILNLGGKSVSIFQFLVALSNTDGKKRMDQMEFFPDIGAHPKPECLDMVRFNIDLAVGQNAAQLKSAAVQIKRDTLIPNLNGGRHLACFD